MSPQGDYRDPPGYGGGGIQLAFPPLEPACKALLIANLAVFAACWLLDLFSPTALVHVIYALGNHPRTWADWFPLLPVWQLATCMFLHGGVMHVLGNMLLLYFLGAMVEGAVGTRRFAALYFGAGLVASLGSLLMRSLLGDLGPSIGASGAVFAAAVAAAAMFPHQRIIVFIFPMKLWVLAAIMIAVNSISAIEELAGRSESMTDIWAHLFGAACGYSAVKLGWIWRDPLAALGAWRAARGERRRADDSIRLDELLGRIHREGIGGLSPAEKAFLKRASKRR